MAVTSAAETRAAKAEKARADKAKAEKAKAEKAKAEKAKAEKAKADKLSIEKARAGKAKAKVAKAPEGQGEGAQVSPPPCTPQNQIRGNRMSLADLAAVQKASSASDNDSILNTICAATEARLKKKAMDDEYYEVREAERIARLYEKKMQRKREEAEARIAHERLKYEEYQARRERRYSEDQAAALKQLRRTSASSSSNAKSDAKMDTKMDTRVAAKRKMEQDSDRARMTMQDRKECLEAIQVVMEEDYGPDEGADQFAIERSIVESNLRRKKEEADRTDESGNTSSKKRRKE